MYIAYQRTQTTYTPAKSTGGVSPAVISALGYLPLWGNSRFHIRVRSLPGVSPKPPFGLILGSTGDTT